MESSKLQSLGNHEYCFCSSADTVFTEVAISEA